MIKIIVPGGLDFIKSKLIEMLVRNFFVEIKNLFNT